LFDESLRDKSIDSGFLSGGSRIQETLKGATLMRSVARSRCLEWITLLALASSTLGQQATSPPLPPEAAPARQSNSTNDQNAAPTTSLPTPGAQDPSSNDQEGMFVFKKQVQEVVLHATVVDENRRLAAYLDRSAFSVFEDGQPQTITSFQREDVPVAIGIVIDNSSSMRDKREQVNQAVLNLIRASNPNDEIFVVNFSQNAYLDQDFTSDINLLERALRRASMQGSTALYDAIVASAVHLKSNTRLEKKLLLVITDGQDNMSRATLQEATQHLQERSGPTLYAIGLMGPGLHRGREALQKLSDATGGSAFFPQSLDQVSEITRALAHDIRRQYTIAYKPQNQNVSASYHPIVVEARATGYGRLTVRTRSGYYTGESVR
jgi:Ca-activated chloride channel homolog